VTAWLHGGAAAGCCCGWLNGSCGPLILKLAVGASGGNHQSVCPQGEAAVVSHLASSSPGGEGVKLSSQDFGQQSEK
jgi:hypothetical protein